MYSICAVLYLLAPNARMHGYFLQNDQFFYLCIRKFLFVAQMNSPRGTSICCTNKRPEYTNRVEINYFFGDKVGGVPGDDVT